MYINMRIALNETHHPHRILKMYCLNAQITILIGLNHPLSIYTHIYIYYIYVYIHTYTCINDWLNHHTMYC